MEIWTILLFLNPSSTVPYLFWLWLKDPKGARTGINKAAGDSRFIYTSAQDNSPFRHSQLDHQTVPQPFLKCSLEL